MRDILGYAPIEPDGSVKVKVPANVAVRISVLDANGRRLAGVSAAVHTNWLQVHAGETLQCNGCHNRRTANSRRAPMAAAACTLRERRAPPTSSAVPEHQSRAVRRHAAKRWPKSATASCAAARANRASISCSTTTGRAAPTPAAQLRCVLRSGRDRRAIAIRPIRRARHACTTALTYRLAALARSCNATWTQPLPRHYSLSEQHIHPLWGADRRRRRQ